MKYNDTSKRVIINPRNFGGAEINTTTDTINIPDHGYETGDKILYTSSNVATPLTTDTVYFVVRNDSNSFKLASTYYQATKTVPTIIGLTGTGSPGLE